MAKVRQRARYSTEFKKSVVRFSLSLPPTARVKPTCRAFHFAIEPVQIRKWIRALQPEIEAEGKSEGESRVATRLATPTPPSEAGGPSESEETQGSRSQSLVSHLSPLAELGEGAGASEGAKEGAKEGAAEGAPVFRDWPASWQAPLMAPPNSKAPPTSKAAHATLEPPSVLPTSTSIQASTSTSATQAAAPAAPPAAETTAAAQDLILLCQSVGGAP